VRKSCSAVFWKKDNGFLSRKRLPSGSPRNAPRPAVGGKIPSMISMVVGLAGAVGATSSPKHTPCGTLNETAGHGKVADTSLTSSADFEDGVAHGYSRMPGLRTWRAILAIFRRATCTIASMD